LTNTPVNYKIPLYFYTIKDKVNRRYKIFISIFASKRLISKEEKQMVMQKLARLVKGKNGQGMTEYIIIVALIAIAAIGIYTLFGKQIREVVGAISGQLGGETGKSAKTIETTEQRGKDITVKDFDN
jgi:Flp pilus assembly pilin Flp